MTGFANIHPSPLSLRCRILITALIVLLAIVLAGIYGVNQRLLYNLQDVELQRMQQRVENLSKNLSTFLEGRICDMQKMASSSIFKQYFQETAHRQTDAERHRPGNALLSRFQLYSHSLWGDEQMYESLALIDAGGKQLLAWPLESAAPAAKQVFPISPKGGEEAKARMYSDGRGRIFFNAPVVIDHQAVGYVQGCMHYHALINHLDKFLPGKIIISSANGIAYSSMTDNAPSVAVLDHLIHNHPSPFMVQAASVERDPQSEGAFQQDAYIFFANIPGRELFLYLIDNDTSIRHSRGLHLFPISTLAFSLGSLLIGGLLHRLFTYKKTLSAMAGRVSEGEKALHEQKQTIELVIKGAQLGTWCWDIENDRVAFNDRFLTMLGYEPNELPARLATWEMLLHPEDKDAVMGALDAHLNGITPSFEIEYRLCHKDGYWVWVLDSGQVLFWDEANRAQRAFGVHIDISERKEANRLLAKAKEQSDEIIRQFLDTLIVVDLQLRVIRVNEATCNLLGYEESELLGRPVCDLFHDVEERVIEVFSFLLSPDTGVFPNEAMHSASASGTSENNKELRNVEFLYRHKDGSQIPMSLNINLLHNEQGAVAGCMAGGKDISALRHAVDTITGQKHYIETIFDLVSVGLVALSPTNEVVRDNQAFRALMEKWALRFSCSVEECSQRMIRRVLSQQSDEAGLVLSLEHDRTKAHFRCTVTTISNLEGIARVLSIDDISSELVAEEAKRFLATVIEQTEDAVLITGTDALIRYTNPATTRITGFSAAELVGRLPSVFTDHLVKLQVLANLRKTLLAGASWSGNLQSRRKDGSVIEEAVTVSPVRNNLGETTHYVAICRDVTKLVTLQRQLLQAQKMESIGQMAAGIAHEINTPMQYVQSNVTFVEESFKELQSLFQTLCQCPRDRLPESVANQLNTVDLEYFLDEIPPSIQDSLQGINRVVQIVAAMREFSHPGNREKTAADINHCLESTLMLCRNEWKITAELVTDLAVGLPLVPCYVDQLHQALVNLIINATHAIEEIKKSRPETVGRLTVTTLYGNGWVEIRIGDNGCGIPDAIRDRIFEPFFTTKGVGKGTGQGLGLVYEVIVNKHGGTVTLESTTGQGTTFILRLPVAHIGVDSEFL